MGRIVVKDMYREYIYAAGETEEEVIKDWNASSKDNLKWIRDFDIGDGEMEVIYAEATEKVDTLEDLEKVLNPVITEFRVPIEIIKRKTVLITNKNLDEFEEIYSDPEIEDITIKIDEDGIYFSAEEILIGAPGREDSQVLDLESYRSMGVKPDFTAYEILDGFIDDYNAGADEEGWERFRLAFEKGVKK
jgi:hypothetical protein|nr:MAG TPA: hypothetical protein [Caudoviricetes sp.]